MKGTPLFRLFGITIYLHSSWWFIVALIAWSLSTAFFPQFFPGLSTKMYWLMGIVSALLLFMSVLFHELSHSLVAKAKRIKVESITLFFFGGVAGIDDEDMKPSSEFWMALAGPFSSLLLAGLFFLLYKFNVQFFVTAISFYLYQLNFILAAFNLVPGFPLDGGRAFRALLVMITKNQQKSTKIAVMGGKTVAFLLVSLGFLGLFTRSGGGLWFILLGIFLYFIANASYEQVVVRQILSKIPVKEVLRTKLITVQPTLTLAELGRAYRTKGEEVFLVAGVGILDVSSLKKAGLTTPLRNLAIPLRTLKALSLHDTLYTAFRSCLAQKVSLLPVMDGKKTMGYVRQDDLLQRLSWESRFSGVRIKRHKK